MREALGKRFWQQLANRQLSFLFLAGLSFTIQVAVGLVLRCVSRRRSFGGRVRVSGGWRPKAGEGVGRATTECVRPWQEKTNEHWTRGPATIVSRRVAYSL